MIQFDSYIFSTEKAILQRAINPNSQHYSSGNDDFDLILINTSELKHTILNLKIYYVNKNIYYTQITIYLYANINFKAIKYLKSKRIFNSTNIYFKTIINCIRY